MNVGEAGCSQDSINVFLFFNLNKWGTKLLIFGLSLKPVVKQGFKEIFLAILPHY